MDEMLIELTEWEGESFLMTKTHVDVDEFYEQCFLQFGVHIDPDMAEYLYARSIPDFENEPKMYICDGPKRGAYPITWVPVNLIDILNARA